MSSYLASHRILVMIPPEGGDNIRLIYIGESQLDRLPPVRSPWWLDPNHPYVHYVFYYL